MWWYSRTSRNSAMTPEIFGKQKAKDTKETVTIKGENVVQL